MTQTTRTPRPRSLFSRIAMGFQAFLLRRNWAGPMGGFVMVITTTGRKSGRRYSTPIGYIRDGETLIGLSVGGMANWFKNLQANPEVELNILGQDRRARAVVVTEAAEREKILALYRNEHAPVFGRLFGVPVDAPAEDLARALAARSFVRFYLH